VRISALLCYADGERRYILAPRGVAKQVDQLMSGSVGTDSGRATCNADSEHPGWLNDPCVIEMLPGKGAQVARSAGASAQAAGA
jgi:large subunit ribosomal protein L2